MKKIIFLNICCIFVLYFLSIIIYAEELKSNSFRIKGDSQNANFNGNSSNFGIVGDLNSLSGRIESSNFMQRMGYNPMLQANVPLKPDLSNPLNYPDRLKIIINPSGNPSDTLFAIAISSDNWTTTKYIKADGTVGSALQLSDYKSYDDWGSEAGSYVISLVPKTKYKIKVKALNGNFTETDFGSSSDEATTYLPYIKMSFSSNYASLGFLNVNSIKRSSDITLLVYSNNFSGYKIKVKGNGNGVDPGLYKDNKPYLIKSETKILTEGTNGYGMQAGGIVGIESDYSAFGSNVGVLPLNPTVFAYNNDASKITGDELILNFQASISGDTVAGNYEDTVYFTINSND